MYNNTTEPPCSRKSECGVQRAKISKSPSYCTTDTWIQTPSSLKYTAECTLKICTADYCSWECGSSKGDSHIACRAYAVPLPCRAAKGLECVFPIWFTQCGRVWFTLEMLRPCHALTMPFFSWPWHSTAIDRRPVGYLTAFGFFWQPRRVPRRLLSEAYQTSSQRSIPTTAKSGISMLQKRRSVKLLD